MASHLDVSTLIIMFIAYCHFFKLCPFFSGALVVRLVKGLRTNQHVLYWFYDLIRYFGTDHLRQCLSDCRWSPLSEWNASIICQILKNFKDKTDCQVEKETTGNNHRTHNKYELQTRSVQEKQECAVTYSTLWMCNLWRLCFSCLDRTTNTPSHSKPGLSSKANGTA